MMGESPLQQSVVREGMAADLSPEEAFAALQAELHEVGLTVNAIDELYRVELPKAAVPILVKWLPELPGDWQKGAVARALRDRSARGVAARALIDEFRAAPPDASYKWPIAYALDVVATPEDFDDLAEIAQDESHGADREWVVAALGNMARPEAVAIARKLLRDDDVVAHALLALARLRAPEARKDVEEFLDSPLPGVRHQARKALKAMETR